MPNLDFKGEQKVAIFFILESYIGLHPQFAVVTFSSKRAVMDIIELRLEHQIPVQTDIRADGVDALCGRP